MSHWTGVVAALLLLLAFRAETVRLAGQGEPAGAKASRPSQAEVEISEHDQPTTFQVKVNLVLVRVVVRDTQGHALGNLHKEDFQLFDEGKPQQITKFFVEQTSSAPATAAHIEAEAAESAKSSPASNPVTKPEHYIAFLFDDVHANFADLIRARDAAIAEIESMPSVNRVGIFSTSGQTTVDFTDDHARLHDALLGLRSRPITGTGQPECPDVSYYMGDLVQNKNDRDALEVVTQDTIACAFDGDGSQRSLARFMAQSAALGAIELGEHETRVALSALGDVVKRLSTAPGQRTIVLLSPGFLNVEQLETESQLIDRALRANVVIDALDARGLYTVVPGGDASQRVLPTSPFASTMKLSYQLATASAENDVMMDISYGTGGRFFHDSNDLKGGLAQLTQTPEYYYVLGFAPEKLKYDGKYHKLKVTLAAAKNLNVEARRGYYAPRHGIDESVQAKEEVEGALFSQEEVKDLPVQLTTQFFKPSDKSAKLAVLARLDVRHFHFQKVEGRNRNDLTVVSGIFDRNGKFIAGTEKILELRLKDETLENKLHSGITLKTSFDVQPGSYFVRLVVREDSGKMAAQNGAIEIP